MDDAGKLRDVSNKLRGCQQIVNGVNLAEEYRKVYAAYSQLYEKQERFETAIKQEAWDWWDVSASDKTVDWTQVSVEGRHPGKVRMRLLEVFVKLLCGRRTLVVFDDYEESAEALGMNERIKSLRDSIKSVIGKNCHCRMCSKLREVLCHDDILEKREQYEA